MPVYLDTEDSRLISFTESTVWDTSDQIKLQQSDRVKTSGLRGS